MSPFSYILFNFAKLNSFQPFFYEPWINYRRPKFRTTLSSKKSVRVPALKWCLLNEISPKISVPSKWSPNHPNSTKTNSTPSSLNDKSYRTSPIHLSSKWTKLSRQGLISALSSNTALEETFTTTFTQARHSMKRSNSLLIFRIALYAAQLILALEHLHAQNIIFKEYFFILFSLKP